MSPSRRLPQPRWAIVDRKWRWIVHVPSTLRHACATVAGASGGPAEATGATSVVTVSPATSPTAVASTLRPARRTIAPLSRPERCKRHQITRSARWETGWNRRSSLVVFERSIKYFRSDHVQLGAAHR